MVARYTRPELGQIWSEENKYNIWLKIEILAVEAREKAGLVPEGVSSRLWKNSSVSAERIEEIEQTTKHDVIAFLTNVEESAGEDARFVHIGMTSSDVLDTCLAVQMKQAGEFILKGLQELSKVCAKRANEFKHTPCVGRSHGIHAETITFGMKFALWYDECQRNIERFSRAMDNASLGMISGAVGTYEHLSPDVEKHVCEKLGLNPVNISTQVISRDVHAEYLNSIAMIGAMIEKIGIEIRHLQRTEVREAEEYFSPGQKGSSAMPHKRNPIASENICGQARFLRTNALAGIENIALWHERDISHSSVERVIMPDSTISCDYILSRTIRLLDKLVVYPDRMLEVLDMTFGLTHSQKILLALVEKGIQRQTAYVIVQRNAMKAWDTKTQFLDALKQDNEVMDHFTPSQLENLFSYEEVFKSVDFMFDRLKISK